jgi:hypothetical protein
VKWLLTGEILPHITVQWMPAVAYRFYARCTGRIRQLHIKGLAVGWISSECGVAENDHHSGDYRSEEPCR